MQKNDLIDYLKKFNISEDKISTFLKGKIIYSKLGNVFLVEKNFEKNEIYKDNLLFIQLKKKLPSKFLLNFIKNTSKNIIDIHSEKQALNFTYSKDLPLKSFKLKRGDDKYILLFNNQILGIGSIKQKEGNIFLINEMNIGEYLREK